MNPDEHFLPEDATQQQFHAEWQQFCEEVELQDLNIYLNELAEYYGNQDDDFCTEYEWPWGN